MIDLRSKQTGSEQSKRKQSLDKNVSSKQDESASAARIIGLAEGGEIALAEKALKGRALVHGVS